MNDIIWKNNRISQLVLGTAQFGMDYGIANIQGQPSEKSACEIVKTAWDNGINCFDSAQIYYGESVLGKALKHREIVSQAQSQLKRHVTILASVGYGV